MFKSAKLKKLSLAVATMLAAGIIAGCGGGDKKADAPKADAKKTYNVGVVQLVEHPALDATNKGFVDGLKKRGIEKDKNLKLDQQNAQADQSNLKNIATRFVNNKVDLIYAIATPAAQTVANATKTIPIVGCAITDYESAKLVEKNAKPNTNVTGASDMNPIKEQVDLLLKIVPNAKTIGTIYTSSEVNSEIQIKLTTEYAKSKGLKVEVATISTVNDIQQAAQSLLGKVDAFYEPTDNVVASAMPTLTAVTTPAKKPVICGEPGMVDGGGLATYGIDYYALGVQAGDMAADILEGKKKPQDMAVQTAKDLSVVVNKDAAEAMGVKIPDDIMKNAKVVTTKK